MAILTVALTPRGKMIPAAYELLTAGRALADSRKEPLCAAVLGSKAPEFAKNLLERGADKVFTLSDPRLDNFNDELHAKTLAALARKEGLGQILLPATVAGRSLAARLSVLLKAGLASEVCEVRQNGTGLKAKRYQYSGNVVSELEFKSQTQVLTVQAMVFPPAEKQAGRAGEIVPVALDASVESRIEFLSYQPEESSEIDLANAERVVSGGRGLGSAEAFKAIRELAQALGAAVGASRAVVDSGWIAYRHQVGLTGRTVRPKLYLACGISGQIQHLAGMSSSGTIIALNTDPDCPMMQMASISVQGDLNELLPLITAEIKRRRGQS
ncbi:MAG: electron transfer flavoprotein subunit alpha/FixB family protein [Elusimicrobia bacterium]|nr:electron transfer flavoprotein subunit alpha/FixB family protein [Elusimicrobiota bacterium]